MDDETCKYGDGCNNGDTSGDGDTTVRLVKLARMVTLVIMRTLEMMVRSVKLVKLLTLVNYESMGGNVNADVSQWPGILGSMANYVLIAVYIFDFLQPRFE